MSTFTSNLLDEDPPIPGLDDTVVISPRRMHLTLGVMSLDQENHSSPSTNESEANTRPLQTLTGAVALLRELRPRILDLLSGEDLIVALNHIDIMRPERGDLAKAHVLFAGPSPRGLVFQRLKAVSGSLNLLSMICIPTI